MQIHLHSSSRRPSRRDQRSALASRWALPTFTFTQTVVIPSSVLIVGAAAVLTDQSFQEADRQTTMHVRFTKIKRNDDSAFTKAFLENRTKAP